MQWRRGSDFLLLPLREKVDTRNAWTDEGYAGKEPPHPALRATLSLKGEGKSKSAQKPLHDPAGLGHVHLARVLGLQLGHHLAHVLDA